MLMSIIMRMNMYLLLHLWLIPLINHVPDHLVRDLTEHLLGEQPNIFSIVIVLDELYNIPLCYL
jgi:hypothetical protein